MTHIELLAVLAKVSGAFMIGLVLSLMFRRDALLRRVIWTVAFASPVIILLPLPKIYLPLLAASPAQRGLTAKVFELQPTFASLRPIYRGDPEISLLVMFVAGFALVGLLVLCWRLIATLRIVRAAEQFVNDDILAQLYELGHQAGLADVPILKRSDAVDSPCVWGVVQPVILIPTDLNPTAEEWELLLRHELIHLRLRDPLRLILFSLLRYALWWNPLVWLGFRDSNLAQEQIIDRELGHHQGYRKLLTSQMRTQTPAAMSRFFGSGHLLTRIRALTSPPSTTSSRPNLMLFAMFAPVLVPYQLAQPYHPQITKIGTDEIVYVSTKVLPSRLWRMASDGRNPSPMPQLFQDVGVASVSPDGGRLAYCRSINGQEDIFVANVDGSGERVIVRTTKRDVQPRWSPDGSSLVFCTLETGNWEIGIAEVGNCERRAITWDGKRNLEPSWHPNGSRIIFSSHRSGAQKLWSMNIDGSELVQLTFGGYEDTHGRYSPDGSLVAFSSVRRTKSEATLLDLRTGWVQPLVSLNQLDTGEVEFSEGSSIVMSSSDGIQPHIGKVRLSDLDFSIISGGGPSLWPSTR